MHNKVKLRIKSSSITLSRTTKEKTVLIPTDNMKPCTLTRGGLRLEALNKNYLCFPVRKDEKGKIKKKHRFGSIVYET